MHTQQTHTHKHTCHTHTQQILASVVPSSRRIQRGRIEAKVAGGGVCGAFAEERAMWRDEVPKMLKYGGFTGLWVALIKALQDRGSLPPPHA